MSDDKPAAPVTSETFDKPLGVADPNAPAEKPATAASPPAPDPAAAPPDKLQAADPATAKVIDDPADANHGDVATALVVADHAAPAPFSKRDSLPDITSESVDLRLLNDYWPSDTARFGNAMRARAGDLKAFPSDEALELIRTGIAERVEQPDLMARRDSVANVAADPPR